MTTTEHRAAGGRRTVRALAACGAASLGLLALTACEKPTPRATVTVGGDTVSTEAVCYGHGEPLSGRELKECQRKQPTRSLTLSPGDILRVGVEPAMADPGWVMYVNGRAISNPMDETYRSLSADGFFSQVQGQGKAPDVAELTIAEEDEEGTVYGVWRVKLNLDA